MRLHYEQLTQEAFDKRIENQPQRASYHIGCSALGNPCDRAVWLALRWATAEKFDGRMLRLFARGQREELEVIRLLRSVRVRITDCGKKQKALMITPWLKGYPDGIIQSGLKESPKKVHILEIKTSNKKSFDELLSKGVQVAKPYHYTQMQLYMYATGIDRAYYICVCKDDDRIFTERFRLDADYARSQIERAQRIATSEKAPARQFGKTDWHCKFCPQRGVCHNISEPKESCRTCEHCIFNADGSVVCLIDRKILSPEEQEKGCNGYETHPDMEVVPWS